MSLEIKPVHLQYPWGLMAVPLKYPDFFYSEAGVFYYLFERIDEKATYFRMQQTKKSQIEQSHFGEIVIMYSERALSSEDLGSEVEKEVIEKTFRDTFLNLAAWYILPLIEATKLKRPYMPESWTTAYMSKVQKMDKKSREAYNNDILDFLENIDSKGWMTPYKGIASKLGENVQESLLILVGMFLEAYEEQKDDDLEPLLPNIIEFMEGIDAVDELNNEDEKNPPS